ncbi:hypothetical protein BBR01nite_01080 [Brevibacillus brevis]|nr:hypothetical protein BBR01nite_01080 [Brevibacillus brevis]
MRLVEFYYQAMLFFIGKHRNFGQGNGLLLNNGMKDMDEMCRYFFNRLSCKQFGAVIKAKDNLLIFFVRL